MKNKYAVICLFSLTFIFSGLFQIANIKSVSADFPVPPTPTGLKAVAISATTVKITWDKPADMPSAGHYIGYNLSRNGSSLGYVKAYGQESYTDSGLNPATVYTYIVNRMDTDGVNGASAKSSPNSAPVSVTTLGDVTAPSIPTNLTAKAIDSTRIDLSWSPSADNTWTAGYYIYRNNIQIGKVAMTGYYYDRTYYSDTNLAANIAYSYKVSAYDSSGNISGKSIAVSAKTFQVPSSAPATSYDFGGMYSHDQYVNPATSALSCPAGYKADKILGTSGIDFYLYACLRPHVDGTSPLYDFGGMSSNHVSNNTTNSDYGNQISLTEGNWFEDLGDSCPSSDYTKIQVLGDPRYDYNLNYCYRPHSNASPAYNLGGFFSSNNSLYPNIATGFQYCPSGYLSETAFGTAGHDFNLTYCYQKVSGSTNTQVPTIPSGLTATVNEKRQVVLNWSASTWQGNTSPVSGYKISRDGIQIDTSTINSYTDTILDAGNHSYAVAAYDPSGDTSPQSTSASITVPQGPPEVIEVSPLSGVSGTVITLSGNGFSKTTPNNIQLTFLNSNSQDSSLQFVGTVVDSTDLKFALNTGTYQIPSGTVMKIWVDNNEFGFSDDNAWYRAKPATFTFTSGTSKNQGLRIAGFALPKFVDDFVSGTQYVYTNVVEAVTSVISEPVSPSYSPTPTYSSAPAHTVSPTYSIIPLAPKPTVTSTISPSMHSTASPSATPYRIPSPTYSPTYSSTPSPTYSSTPSYTYSPTPSYSPTPTNTYSPSPTYSATPTNSSTPTPAQTVTVTPTPATSATPVTSTSPSPSVSQTPAASYTPSPTTSNPPAQTSTPTPSTSPAPTATLTANGVHSLTLNVGDNLTYYWYGTNADSYYSTYTSNNAYQCGAGGAWSLGNTSNGISNSVVPSGAAGCTWYVTYTAYNHSTGMSVSDSIVVKINSSANPSPSSSPHASPSGSPSAFNTNNQVSVLGLMVSSLLAPWTNLANVISSQEYR